jgi:hypothetical protein
VVVPGRRSWQAITIIRSGLLAKLGRLIKIIKNAARNFIFILLGYMTEYQHSCHGEKPNIFKAFGNVIPPLGAVVPL